MKGYVARDKDGNAFLFKNKPYKDFIAWKEDSDEFILFMDNNNLPSDINPQWEDEEPIEVEINITKVSDVVTISKDRYEQLLQYEQEYIQQKSMEEQTMKELSMQEKANRYDKAIEIAKSKIKNDKDHVLYEDDVIDIFPELKVSDDEGIRKSLIELFHDTVSNDVIFSDYGLDKTEVLAWLEKQREQESVDKVAPKFKVGDWFVKNNIVYHIDKISGVYLTLSTLDGTELVYHTNVLDDDKIHLWTIKDAKDGDVLRLGDVIAIFKKYIGQENCICYCSFCEDGNGFEIPIENGEDNVYGCTDTTPATKEQRDLLFAKMKEAGYEWNEDTKELIKL